MSRSPSGPKLLATDCGRVPIQAVTATTPQGLLTATPTALVTPGTLPQVYGPSITDIQEINGKEVISMRVSNYGDGHYGKQFTHGNLLNVAGRR